jgi:hypothetical protein
MFSLYISHISFISFNQSLQVNGPLDMEHVTVGLFRIISQGKTVIMHKYKYKGCKCNTNHYVVDTQGASLSAINLSQYKFDVHIMVSISIKPINDSSISCFHKMTINHMTDCLT